MATKVASAPCQLHVLPQSHTSAATETLAAMKASVELLEVTWVPCSRVPGDSLISWSPASFCILSKTEIFYFGNWQYICSVYKLRFRFSSLSAEMRFPRKGNAMCFFTHLYLWFKSRRKTSCKIFQMWQVIRAHILYSGLIFHHFASNSSAIHKTHIALCKYQLEFLCRGIFVAFQLLMVVKSMRVTSTWVAPACCRSMP